MNHSALRTVSSGRHSTVFDLTSLRLHPDGTRVPQTARLRNRKSRAVVRDSRGNWIASDAGGSGEVKKRRSMRKRRDKVPEEAGDEEVFDFTGVDGGESDENIMKGKGKEKEKTDDEEFEPKSATARKRRRFADDLTFLDAGSQQQPVVTGVSLLPTPSSDLLKCIHHFASVYYGDQGQLFDAPRQHRREKRLRRLERHKGAPEEYSSAHSQDEDSDEDDGDSKRTSDDRESDSDDDDPGKGGSGASASDEENRAARAPPKKDMYKIMDGSALMAIGMLLQEHVAKLLSRPIPPGWEDEMLEQADEM